MGLVQRLKGLTGFTATGVGRFLTPSDNTSSAPNSTISPEKALANAYKNPVVCAVVEWITTQASPTPLYMEQAVDEDTVEVVRQHPLLNLLKTPSPFMSGRELPVGLLLGHAPVGADLLAQGPVSRWGCQRTDVSTGATRHREGF